MVRIVRAIEICILTRSSVNMAKVILISQRNSREEFVCERWAINKYEQVQTSSSKLRDGEGEAQL